MLIVYFASLGVLIFLFIFRYLPLLEGAPVPGEDFAELVIYVFGLSIAAIFAWLAISITRETLKLAESESKKRQVHLEKLENILAVTRENLETGFRLGYGS